MDVSVIIVNYNVKEFLLNLLYSLQKTVSSLSVEILVVDNASSDGSLEAVRKSFPEVLCIASDTNLGFSRANNLALKQAKGKYLLLINPDTIVQEDTIETLVSFLNAHPEAGMAGCKVLNPDGTLQLACRRSFPGPWTSFCKVTGLSSIFPKSKLLARYNLTYLDENQTYEVDALSGSCMMITREAYKKIGGLDEIFFMYGEDLDWCYRVQKAGFKVYYVHTTQIIHYKGESTKRSSLNETKVFYNAMHIFVKKHLSSSFLMSFMLRSAIFIRALVAFLGTYKTILLSLFLDVVFYTGSLALAERVYAMRGNWIGFPAEAVPIIFTFPVSIHVLTTSLLGIYKKDSFSILKNFGAIGVSFILLAAITFFFKEYAYSRGVVLVLYLLLLFILTGWRVFLKFFFKIGISGYETTGYRTAVVGTADASLEILKKLSTQFSGFRSVLGIVGYSFSDIGKKFGDYQVLGSLENIAKVIEEHHIKEIIFPAEGLSYQKMMSIVASCQHLDIEFKIAGSNLDFLVGKTSVSVLDNIPLVELHYNISSASHMFIKRTFDIAFGILLLPAYPLVLFLNAISKDIGEISRIVLSAPAVILGRISFVGPKHPETYKDLYLGKRGVTGLWFIENEHEENSEKMDIFYAKNQNIWLDLEILGKTFTISFFKMKNENRR